MSRQLIVNADDFGRTRGVSLGILRAHREGIVTSASAMMNMPGVAHDLHLAQAEAPRLGLGVHLTFTAGRPLLPVEWVRSLVDEHGHFLSQETILQNPQRIDRDELKSELKAQVAAFANVLGHPPDHLDAHHFAHLLPPLFEVYLDLAAEFKLPVRMPLPPDGSTTDVPALIGELTRDQLLPIVAADRALLQARSIRTPDRCVLSFFGATVSAEQLLQLLDDLPEGVTELMTHPGVADEALTTESSYHMQREAELSALTDPRVLVRVHERGIELATFAVLS